MWNWPASRDKSLYVLIQCKLYDCVYAKGRGPSGTNSRVVTNVSLGLEVCLSMDSCYDIVGGYRNSHYRVDIWRSFWSVRISRDIMRQPLGYCDWANHTHLLLGFHAFHIAHLLLAPRVCCHCSTFKVYQGWHIVEVGSRVRLQGRKSSSWILQCSQLSLQPH